MQICDITCHGCGLRLWGDCSPVAHKWNRRAREMGLLEALRAFVAYHDRLAGMSVVELLVGDGTDEADLREAGRAAIAKAEGR
jgi:hypothetical protein